MASIKYRDKIIHLAPHVYPPAEDSFLMIDALSGNIQNDQTVLELGCGSGIISVFARDYSSKITATDLSPHAVNCAKLNGIPAIRTDLFAGIKGTFDLVIFNPPYLPTSEEEYTGIWDDLMVGGGSDGRKTIERFIAEVGDHLSPKGRVLLLVSSLTGIEEVCRIMRNRGLNVEIAARSRHFFEELVVLKGWF